MSDESGAGSRYRELLGVVRDETEVGLDARTLRDIEDRVLLPRRATPALSGMRLSRAWIAGLAGAALAGGVVWLAPAWRARHVPALEGDRSVATLARSSGDVLRRNAAGEAIAPEEPRVGLGDGVTLAEGAVLDLEVERRARLSFIGPVRGGRDTDGSWVLDRGVVHVWVRPGAQGAPLVLRAGEEQITVTGTDLSVGVGDEGKLSVMVHHGTVVVRGPQAGRELRLGAGESLGPALAGAAPSHERPAPWWGEAADTGYLAVRSTPPGATARLGGWQLGSTPVLVRWPVGMHELVLSTGEIEAWSKQVRVEPRRTTQVAVELTAAEPTRRASSPASVWKDLLARGACAELAGAVAELRRGVPAAVDGARGLLLLGECHLRRGDRAAALSTYAALSTSYAPSAEFEAAWFEAARLHAEVGDVPGARRAIERYLTTFPRGRFVAEVSLRRCELDAAEGRQPEARRCLDEHLMKYPQALRRTAALLLHAEICRSAGDFGPALASYRELLARRDLGDQAEVVRYRRVTLIREAGLAGLGAAVADYLAHHPDGPHADEMGKLLP